MKNHIGWDVVFGGQAQAAIPQGIPELDVDNGDFLTTRRGFAFAFTLSETLSSW